MGLLASFSSYKIKIGKIIIGFFQLSGTIPGQKYFVILHSIKYLLLPVIIISKTPLINVSSL
jgi:hypothetical protein